MKSLPKVYLIIVCVFMLASCATNLPMTSTINDFVMMGIKTSSEDVSFAFETKIQDGLIKPYTKDKEAVFQGHPGYNHSESATLAKMMNEYIGNRFPNINSDGKTSIKVTLTDFWLEEYSPDSGGKRVLTAFFGGETNIILVVKIKAQLNIERNGEDYTKNISVTSEEQYVAGVGTGTSTSLIHRGKDSRENVIANNINKANNKVLMVVNAYFEEAGI